MLQQRRYTNREYVLAGAFALLALFPIATGTLSGAAFGGSVAGTDIARAYDDREHQTKLKRLRWSVLRDCAQREAAGEENVCPDPNDYGALRTYWLPKEGETATIDETIDLTVKDLGRDEQAILRRASRTGSCPADLDGVRSGFQKLCESMVKGSPRADAIEDAIKGVMERSYR
jgi:hypothetical protein